MGQLIKRELKHLDQLLNLSINLGLVKLQLTGSKGLLVQLQVSHFFKFKLQGMASSAGFKYGD